MFRLIAFGAFFLFALGWYEYDRRVPPRRQRFDDALADHVRGALDESRKIAVSAREFIRPPVEKKSPRPPGSGKRAARKTNTSNRVNTLSVGD